MPIDSRDSLLTEAGRLREAAEKTDDQENRARMLELADCWVQMANEEQKLAKRSN
jgi:hypothetical protein